MIDSRGLLERVDDAWRGVPHTFEDLAAERERVCLPPGDPRIALHSPHTRALRAAFLYHLDRATG